MEQAHRDKEIGFERLVSFSDAVAAIAITVLVLPLVDVANKIGSESISDFYRANRSSLFAFVLSFVLIGNYWWNQHQLLRHLRAYDSFLVAAMFLWLFSIVVLPLPTELLGSSKHHAHSVDILYVASMLLVALAEVFEQWAVVRSPDLSLDSTATPLTADSSLVMFGLMVAALVVCTLSATIGLWSLLLIGLAHPIRRALAQRRHRVRTDVAS